jgi:hypothetical protein
MGIKNKGSRCYVRLDNLRQLESKKRNSTSMKSCDVWLGLSSMWKEQLSSMELVEVKKISFCSTNCEFDGISQRIINRIQPTYQISKPQKR